MNFLNGILVRPEGLQRAHLSVKGKHIASISPTAPAASEPGWDMSGKYLLPGFIDIHHHGALGFDCVWGAYDPEKDAFVHEAEAFAHAFKRSLAFCLQMGITRLFPTTMAAPRGQLLQSLRWMEAVLRDAPPWNCLVGGINLEGSFLKLPAYAGAQNPDYFYEPSLEFVQAVQQASGQRLKVVNLPPEHGPRGLDLTRSLVEQGIVVAGGHSGASYDQFMQAAEEGLSLAVHFLNGPSRSSSKPFGGGGALEAMLSSDEVYVELIVDGWHIHPAYVRDTLARKGTERAIAITDSMFANGLSKLKRFTLGGLRGTVSEEREYLKVADREDTLFGSILRPPRSLENLLNWLTQPMPGRWHRHHPALPFDEALPLAARMLSTHPARLLKLDGVGSLDIGQEADILVVDIQEAEQGLEVFIEAVMLQGAWVHGAPPPQPSPS